MNALLDMATKDFRYADFIDRLGQHDEACRIRKEARGLLSDMPRSNPVLQATAGTGGVKGEAAETRRALYSTNDRS